jgi:hypothetical protein
MTECPHEQARDLKRYYVKDPDDPSRQAMLCEACYRGSGRKAYMHAVGGSAGVQWWVIGGDDT